MHGLQADLMVTLDQFLAGMAALGTVHTGDYWPIKFHMHVTRAHRLCTLRM